MKDLIPHLSYSAIRTFMTSPAKFWQRYVMRDRFKPILIMVAGQAWHYGLELLYLDDPDWKGKGLQLLLDKAESIDDLEEGELDKEAVRLEANFELYEELDLDLGEILHVEKFVTAPSPIEGGLPIKCGVDLIVGVKKKVLVTDHKYVKRFDGKPEEFYYIQAWFCYHATKAITGKYPTHFQVAEFKKTANRKEGPRHKIKVIKYKKEWLDKISEWYKNFCKDLLSRKAFLPNPFQIYDAEDWLDYLKN